MALWAWCAYVCVCVWKMERTIRCSNARPKPIVSAWPSFTLIALNSRTLWAFKNRLIKIIFSSLWQQPGRHYSRQSPGRSAGAGLAALTRQIRASAPSQSQERNSLTFINKSPQVVNLTAIPLLRPPVLCVPSPLLPIGSPAQHARVKVTLTYFKWWKNK